MGFKYGVSDADRYTPPAATCVNYDRRGITQQQVLALNLRGETIPTLGAYLMFRQDPGIMCTGARSDLFLILSCLQVRG